MAHAFNPNSREAEAVVAQALNPSTGEAEADESLCIPEQPRLHSENLCDGLNDNGPRDASI